MKAFLCLSLEVSLTPLLGLSSESGVERDVVNGEELEKRGGREVERICLYMEKRNCSRGITSGEGGERKGKGEFMVTARSLEGEETCVKDSPGASHFGLCQRVNQKSCVAECDR
jgi:hypothetical protein